MCLIRWTQDGVRYVVGCDLFEEGLFDALSAVNGRRAAMARGLLRALGVPDDWRPPKERSPHAPPPTKTPPLERIAVSLQRIATAGAPRTPPAPAPAPRSRPARR